MITIRSEKAKDYTSITQVNDIGFKRKAEGRLIKQLRKREEFISELSIVAKVDKKIVGHVLFTPVEIKDGNKTHKTLSLAPMSILPEFQKKSIGKLLIIYGLQKAKDLGFTSVTVLGHPSYYPRLGFEVASKYGIKSPFPAPDEAFLIIELKKGSLKNVKGQVVFPDEFNEV